MIKLDADSLISHNFTLNPRTHILKENVEISIKDGFNSKQPIFQEKGTDFIYLSLN